MERGLSPATAPGCVDWERLWAPYDEATYQAALSAARPEDVVLDIGAGDLRFGTRLARTVRKVYAIEVQESLIQRAASDRPENLVVICADARWHPFPEGITLGVLLMRHCRHFSLYLEKLTAAGCHRLVTNARWRMGVEVIHLPLSPISPDQAGAGWYACQCGKTGFTPGSPDWVTPGILEVVQEVSSCARCQVGAGTRRDRREPG